MPFVNSFEPSRHDIFFSLKEYKASSKASTNAAGGRRASTKATFSSIYD